MFSNQEVFATVEFATAAHRTALVQRDPIEGMLYVVARK